MEKQLPADRLPAQRQPETERNYNMVTFEKASVFGQQHERDTKYNGSVSVLSFIRMIYGLKLEKVYHFDISSGFYSRFPGILLSEDEVMLFSGSLEIHKNPWWYNS